MHGDGNSFYRALSWWITGEEDFHHTIRQQLAKVILATHSVFLIITSKYYTINKLLFLFSF